MDANIKALINKRVHLEMRGRDDPLDKCVRNAVSMIGARGVRGTSIGELLDIFRNEAKFRVANIWIIIHKIITETNMNVSHHMKPEIFELLTSLTKEHTNHLPSLCIEKVGKTISGCIGKNASVEDYVSLIIKDRDTELEKQETELDIFVLNYLTRSKATGGQIINVYGPNGSIQTGPQSVATINIDLHNQELTEILRQASEEIEVFSGYSPEKKRDLRGMVVEAVEEAQKREPNNTKLNSILSSLSDTFMKANAVLAGAEKIAQTGQKLAPFIERLSSLIP